MHSNWNQKKKLECVCTCTDTYINNRYSKKQTSNITIHNPMTQIFLKSKSFQKDKGLLRGPNRLDITFIYINNLFGILLL